MIAEKLTCIPRVSTGNHSTADSRNQEIKPRRRKERKKDHQDTGAQREANEWDMDEHRVTPIKIFHRRESPLEKLRKGRQKAKPSGLALEEKVSTFFFNENLATRQETIVLRYKADSTH